MRLLTYNIRYGGRGRERLVASVIDACAPDLVVLQEAIDPAVVARIADRTGLPGWGARAGLSLGYLARVLPASAEWHWAPSARHAHLDIRPAGSRWRVIGVHLRAIHASWTERRRVLDLRALLHATREARQERHVFVGDFNTLAPGEDLDLLRLPPRLRPFVWLSGGRIRWRVVQALLDAGYADAYHAARERGPLHTFPTPVAHMRLDYAFVPAPLAPAVRSCGAVNQVAEGATASDHLPLLVELDEPATEFGVS